MTWGQRVRTALRARELAGDRRAGLYPRGKARRLQREFARRNWKPLVGLWLMTLAVALAVSLIVPNPYIGGVSLGTSMTAVTGLLMFMVVQMTGTASVMMGDLAEQWTAQELRKLRRDGWRTVNHVRLKVPDIDHVLIGAGGIWAVETKWSSSEWHVNPPGPGVLKAARHAASSARSMSLWVELRSLVNEPVLPLVVLWGGVATDRPHDEPATFVEGVPVVAGRELEVWTQGLAPSGLTRDQIDGIWEVIEQRCQKTDPEEAADASVPISLFALACRLLAVLASGLAGILATSWVLTLPIPAWTMTAVLAGAVVGGLAVMRFRQRVRMYALAGTTGVAATSGLVLLLSALYWLRS